MRRSRSDELLPKLALICPNCSVGNVEYFRSGTIVCLDRENLGGGRRWGKLQDVVEVSASPRVNALRVVAHDHDVSVPLCDQINKLGLNAFRVLKLETEKVME